MVPPLVTLLTDFGEGGYVPQMKGVIDGIAPEARIVDLCHSIPPHNVAAAAWMLRDVVEAFDPRTIHVAVVDPEVGSARNLIAAENSWGRFVAPDNGLLELVLDAALAPPARVVRLTNESYWRHPVAPTFHGRDILAPVAAWIARGISLEQFGAPLASWKRLSLPIPEPRVDGISGRIVRADPFGNLITNLPERCFFKVDPASFVIRCGALEFHALKRYYSEVEPRAPLALIGSHGFLEIAVANGNGLRELGLSMGDEVDVRW